MTGTVRTLIRDKGFGFIACEEGKDVFFHRSELLNAPFSQVQEGDKVEFEAETGARGPRAREVHLVS